MVADAHAADAVVGNGVGEVVAHGAVLVQQVFDGGSSRGLVSVRFVIGFVMNIRALGDVAVAYLLILQVFQQVLT